MRKLTMVVLVLSVGCWTAVDSDEQPPPEPFCSPRDVRCEGPVLQLCNDDGTAWAPSEVCASAESCDPEQGCQPLACVVGETRCFGDRFQRCAADGLGWDTIANCISAASCESELGCR